VAARSPESVPASAPSDAAALPATTLQARGLVVALGAWAVGVQTSEALATAGLAGCLLAAVWVFVRSGRETIRAGLRDGWPLCALLGWGLLASTMAGRPPSGSGLARLLDWVGVPAVAWALGCVGARGGRIVLWLAGSALLVSSLAAGLQHFGLWPQPETVSALLHLELSMSRVYEAIPGTEGRFMGGGLLFHRLKFANVSSLAVLALLAFGLRARGRERVLALATAAAGLGAVLVFPYARAASVALLGACVAAIILGSSRRRLALLVCGLLVAGAGGIVLLKPSLRARFANSLTSEGSGGRTALLQAGVSALRTYPLAGTGAGRFRVGSWTAPDAPAVAREHTAKAHNQLLTIAVELGLPGLALFLWMLVSLARRMRPSTPEGVAGLSAILFFLILSATHDPLFHAPFSMAFVLLLGASMRGSAARAR
jgi:O-antigen ligase